MDIALRKPRDCTDAFEQLYLLDNVIIYLLDICMSYSTYLANFIMARLQRGLNFLRGGWNRKKSHVITSHVAHAAHIIGIY